MTTYKQCARCREVNRVDRAHVCTAVACERCHVVPPVSVGVREIGIILSMPDGSERFASVLVCPDCFLAAERTMPHADELEA